MFSGDNDDFTGDIVNTELGLFTDIEELSVSSCFYQSGQVWGFHDSDASWTGVPGKLYGEYHIFLFEEYHIFVFDEGLYLRSL